jgi:hypothetical protein
MPPLVRGALLLDVGMSAQAAIRRLAQHGFWIDRDQPSVRSWLEEYVARIAGLLSRAAMGRPAGSDPEPVRDGPTAGLDLRGGPPTVEEAARLLARPVEDEWALIRREEGVTIFWYAFRIPELLAMFSHVAPERTLREALDLHEYTSTQTIQAKDLVSSDSRVRVVLNGLSAVGVKEPGKGTDDLKFDVDDTLRGPTTTVAPTVPSIPSEPGAAEAAGVTVRGFPSLDAPDKVAVGVPFDLEIGLSDAPVVGVATTGAIVLHAPAGTTTIPVEVQVIAEGFSAPEGWRRTLDVTVADPTKARVKIPLIAMPQAEAVRLTQLSVHFVVGGVARGAALRNVVVESRPGTAPPPDARGLSWLDAAEPRPVITLNAIPFVPDVELDIGKPDGNITRGNYRCVMRNAHGVPVPDEALLIDLGEDASTFAKLLIDQIRQYSGNPLVAILLEGVAAQIADKLPVEFWKLLRSVATKVTDRPITLQLNSAEPYVPWELALVEPPIDPARPSFLGAQVAMGRWILGDRNIASPPRHARSIRAMAVMAGMYKSTAGLIPLPQAIEEAKALTQSFAAMPAVPLDCTAANFQTLLEAKINFNFNSIGGVECVHFAGHGEVDPTRPGDAAIYLNDGQPITPLFFRNCTLGKTNGPFLFLNACMVGAAGHMLGDYGGFPGNCLAGGFCGLVAPLWAVNDSVAKSFAIEFYREALSAQASVSLAEILRQLRAKYDRQHPVSSYLAYVYYGNPHLRLSWTAPAAASPSTEKSAVGGDG